MIELNGSTQWLSVPATVLNTSVMTISMWCRPDFLPADATANYFVGTAAAAFYLRHGSTANQLVGSMDGRTATYDCTGLWVAGQLIHVLIEWNKAAGTIVVRINGTVIAPSYSGSAGSTVIGALNVGASSSGTNLFDGDIGAVAIWNRVLIASEIAALVAGVPANECALSGLTWSAPSDVNEQPDWYPGGEVATVVGSPLISQHPLCLRRGARVLVEGFQSALGETGQFENAGWVLTGTSTAGTKIEGVAAPAGTPLALGTNVLQVDHADGENALYQTKTVAAMTRGYLRVHFRRIAATASARAIVSLWTAAGNEVVHIDCTTTSIYVYYHNGTSEVLLGSAVAGSWSRWVCIDISWDTVAQSVSASIDGSILATVSTPLRGAVAKVLVGAFSTSGTTSWNLAGLDIRSDRRSGLPYDGAYDLDGTTDYLTAPQAVATAIKDEGAIAMWVRPDFLPIEAVERYFFDGLLSSGQMRLIRISTGNGLYYSNGGRTLYAVNNLAGRWSAGQWVHLLVHWQRSSDTIAYYVNGAEVSGAKGGVWVAGTASTAMTFGTRYNVASFLDGALGRIHVFSQLLTAEEIASLSGGRHPREVCPSKWIESWKPGSLVGEKGAYNLTKGGAPALDVGPGIQDAVGAVKVRSHFEGVGYEQPWTVAGTPTANTLIDPDAARPAGWPAWAGQPCRFKQLATENAMNISKVLSASDLDTFWYRDLIYVATLPGAAVYILDIVGGASSTILMTLSNTGAFALGYHIAAGWQWVTPVTVAVGRCYYVEIGYSVSGKWVAYRINGQFGNKPYTYINNVVLDRGGLRSLFLRTSGVTTYSIDMYRGMIEGRTGSPTIPPFVDIDTAIITDRSLLRKRRTVSN